MSYTRPSYIAFGANLSNPKETFQSALFELGHRDVRVKRLSSLWQSPAWPSGSDQPDYTNACAEVEFSGTARALLSHLHAVEAHFGRIRTVVNAPRSLDLDLIDFQGQVLEASDITLPHPRLSDRGFVLLPLSELNPKWKHPASHQDVWRLIGQLPTQDVLSLKCLGHWAHGTPDE